MKYQKLINLLGNTPNLPTTFGTKKWVEINKNGLGIYNTNSQIKLKTSMLKFQPQSFNRKTKLIFRFLY